MFHDEAGAHSQAFILTVTTPAHQIKPSAQYYIIKLIIMTIINFKINVIGQMDGKNLSFARERPVWPILMRSSMTSNCHHCSFQHKT